MNTLSTISNQQPHISMLSKLIKRISGFMVLFISCLVIEFSLKPDHRQLDPSLACLCWQLSYFHLTLVYHEISFHQSSFHPSCRLSCHLSSPLPYLSHPSWISLLHLYQPWNQSYHQHELHFLYHLLHACLPPSLAHHLRQLFVS